MMLRKRSNFATSTSFQNVVKASFESITVAMQASFVGEESRAAD
jgi:hypothetical protein